MQILKQPFIAKKSMKFFHVHEKGEKIKKMKKKKGEVIKAFGVPQRPGGFASRQSFLVKDGKIIWRDLKATPLTQAQDAIAAAKENS